MNILVTFEAVSLHHGLSKFDDHETVKVAIGLVLQWLLNAVHAKANPDQVIDRVNMVVSETFVYAEYMLGDNTMIDNATGMASRYPLVHSEDKNYSFGEYSTAHSSLYCRYSEIVEHLVLNYARQVMGFLQMLEQDKHATHIQCLEYTDRYIAALVHCRNLIEYNHE
ncbi:hypothetical protein D3C81_199890 [compost metagenome]